MQQDYVCVSTYGRTLDAQLSGCAERGTTRSYARRRAAHRLIGGSCFGGLARGDVVIVTQIDRLARSTFDLFVIVKDILAAGGSPAHWLNRGPIQPPAPDG